MANKNARGVLVPGVDEDIHAGLMNMADNLGVITQASSIASARAIASRTPGVSPSTPMYFDVDGVLWKHDGAVFTPASPVDSATDYYTRGWNSSLGASEYSGMATTSLPTRPYNRVFIATAQAWGHSPSGHVDLVLTTDGTATPGSMSLARWSTGTDTESATVTLLGTIPAGQKPNIHMGIRGGSPAGGRLVLSADPRLQRLHVLAFPAPTI